MSRQKCLDMFLTPKPCSIFPPLAHLQSPSSSYEQHHVVSLVVDVDHVPGTVAHRIILKTESKKQWMFGGSENPPVLPAGNCPLFMHINPIKAQMPQSTLDYPSVWRVKKYSHSQHIYLKMLRKWICNVMQSYILFLLFAEKSVYNFAYFHQIFCKNEKNGARKENQSEKQKGQL